jgi:hypothetical protein
MSLGARLRPTWIVPFLILVCCTFAAAQRFRGVMEGPGVPPRFPPEGFGDGAFAHCKLMYTSVWREANGYGWSTDYPYAGINLMTRVGELTKTPVSVDKHGEPNYWVVRLTDDALFRCPFLMGTDVGTLEFSPQEARRLREYLLKGGFLWVDDFWGSAAWDHWRSQIERVLPPSEYPIMDVPPGDPIFRSQFQVAEMPQITNIQFWRGVGGQSTSERGTDSADVHLRAIRDAHGQIMVLMSHNTDVADSWEREGEDPGFFYQFSPDGYALGINVLLHAMTH